MTLMRTAAALCGAAWLAATAPAMAQTFGPGAGATDFSTTQSSSDGRGQTFIAPGSALTQVRMNYSAVGQSVGTYTFSINNMSGSTIGSTLYSTTFTPTVGVNTFAGYRVNTVQGGTYAFIISPFGAQPGTGSADISLFRDNRYGSGGIIGLNGNNPEGQTVSAIAGLDFAFDAIAAAAPEPGTWALMILGFGVVGTTLRRRQRGGRDLPAAATAGA